MPSTAFPVIRAPVTPDAIAPDGSEVRLLCATGKGSMALFSLPPGAIARAVAHRTVEELWYVVRGNGRIWRKSGEDEEVVELAPGTAISIASGTHFQFRNEGDGPLEVIGVTMPPWPGDGEALAVEGNWPPTV